MFWASVGGAVFLCAGAAYPVVTGRTNRPVYGRLTAETALDKARAARAMIWAPREWTAAQSKLHTAIAETRRQEVRFFFFRNFENAREQLTQAVVAASTARERAIALREEARQTARDSLDRAEEIVSRTEHLTGSIRIDTSSRRALRQSKLALGEAQQLWRQEAYAVAATRADEAVTRARRAQGFVAALAARYVDEGELRRWRKWKQETIDWSRRSGGAAIVVNKDRHDLTLYVSGRPIRRYAAEFGFNHLARKIRSGDGATPEGRYRITSKKDRGRSKYHRALDLDYPNDEDRRRFREARKSGELPAEARPGGLIEIHGDGGRGWDWTKGCVALRNKDIDDLFPRVPVGTPVTIIGGDDGDGKFASLAQSLEAEKRNGVSRVE